MIHGHESSASLGFTDSRTSRASFRTGGTRPASRVARPPSTRGDPKVVCALTESRGVAATVGLAIMLINTGRLILCEVSDSQTYVHTIRKICVFNPAEILVSATAVSSTTSKLCAIIEENLSDAKLVPFARNYYSQESGEEYINTLSLMEELEQLKVVLSSKFYAVCAAAAVLRFAELKRGLRFALHSLWITYEPGEGSALMDFGTVRNLELIQNMQNSRSKECLLGVLNHTCTPMGSRLLRSNILQPLLDIDTIEARLDAVEELTRNDEVFFALRQTLKAFNDMDRLLASLITIPIVCALNVSEQSVNDVILLKTTLRSIPPMREALDACESSLLATARAHFSSSSIAAIESMIDQCINEDVHWVKGSLDLRNQRCYAVKAGVNGLLDVARQTYKEATDDVVTLVQEYGDEHQFGIDLKFENSRGFYMRVHVSELEEQTLPPIFINSLRRKKFVEFTTLDLLKRNAKIRDSLNEILLMSNETMEALIQSVRSEIGGLYKVCESIAMVDMIVAFTHQASMYRYARPEFNETFAVKNGRHPVREIRQIMDFTPNDAYITHNSRFQIITGVNMSGKSTYLKQHALLTIMA